jgi:hypothetical protein
MSFFSAQRNPAIRRRDRCHPPWRRSGTAAFGPAGWSHGLSLPPGWLHVVSPRVQGARSSSSSARRRHSAWSTAASCATWRMRVARGAVAGAMCARGTGARNRICVEAPQARAVQRRGQPRAVLPECPPIVGNGVLQEHARPVIAARYTAGASPMRPCLHVRGSRRPSQRGPHLRDDATRAVSCSVGAGGPGADRGRADSQEDPRSCDDSWMGRHCARRRW